MARASGGVTRKPSDATTAIEADIQANCLAPSANLSRQVGRPPLQEPPPKPLRVKPSNSGSMSLNVSIRMNWTSRTRCSVPYTSAACAGNLASRSRKRRLVNKRDCGSRDFASDARKLN